MPVPADPEPVLVDLSDHESWELLATVPIGRFATCLPGEAPVVLPVNFIVDGHELVFRTGEGEKLRGALRGPVSFEVDDFDPLRRLGWSVLLQGVAYEVDPSELTHLDLSPWAAGDRRHWIRVTPLQVTGRRITLASGDIDPRGYL